jgi:phage tail sheath gpL-like
MSTIPFNQIPARLRVPGVYIEQTAKLQSTGERLNTVLHIGYANGGSADPNEIYKIGSLSEARALFGGNSMLAEMADRHLRLNKGLVLYQVAVPPPTAHTAALGAIQIDAPAAAAGLLSVRIADRLISISLTKAQTETQIATALAAAINAEPTCWVEADVTGALVGIEAKIPGLLGNQIPIITGYNFEERPPIAITITPMSGGTGAPDLTAALAEMGENPYDNIVSAFLDTANLQRLDETVAERWHAMAAYNIESIVYGVEFGTHATLQAAGKQRNSEFVSIMGVEGAPQTPWVWAASTVAIAADRLTNDPSQPVTTAEVPGLKAPRKCWNWKQRNELLYSGVSTFTSDKAGNVYLEKLITTYQVDPQGYPDASYLSIHVPELMRNVRRVQNAMLATAFRGYKLTDYPEQHAGGQKITSPAGITAYLISIYEKHLIGQRSWCTDFFHYKATIRAERDPDNRSRINYHDEPVMIGQLDIIAGQSELQHG